jgi:MFS family permease
LSQQETPHEMMGRVSSSFMSLIAMAQVLGLMISGYLAQLLGIRKLFVTSAIFLGILALAGYMLVRKPKTMAAASA